MLEYNLFDYIWSLLNWRGYSNWVGGSYLIIILDISNCVPAFKKVVCPHFFFLQILSNAFNGSKLFYFPFLRHYSKSSSDETSTSSTRKVIVRDEMKLLIQVFFLPLLIKTSCHCLFCHGIRALSSGRCPVLSHLGKEAQAKAIWKKILEI